MVMKFACTHSARFASTFSANSLVSASSRNLFASRTVWALRRAGASKRVGTPYSQTFAASGGQTPYTWSISGGTLPAGVTLNASTGVLAGTPTIGGNFSVSVQVVDNARLTGSQTFSLAIGVPAPPKDRKSTRL